MNETEKFFGGVNRGIGFIRGFITFILVLLIGSFASEDMFGNAWGFFAMIGAIALIVVVVALVNGYKK